MMVWALASGMLLAAQASGSDISSSYEMLEGKKYGNCSVWTQVDMFTDSVSHHVKCKEETIGDVTGIALSDWGSKKEVRLSKGILFHLEAGISVAFRIDKGELVEREAFWNADGQDAVIQDESIYIRLLKELSGGERVAIQVGDERGHLMLEGVQQAMADFTRRTEFRGAIQAAQE